MDVDYIRSVVFLSCSVLAYMVVRLLVVSPLELHITRVGDIVFAIGLWLSMFNWLCIVSSKA